MFLSTYMVDLVLPALNLGGVPHDFSVSPSPLGTNLGFELGCTWLGLGLVGFGTKGYGTGLDNFPKHFRVLASVPLICPWL